MDQQRIAGALGKRLLASGSVKADGLQVGWDSSLTQVEVTYQLRSGTTQTSAATVFTEAVNSTRGAAGHTVFTLGTLPPIKDLTTVKGGYRIGGPDGNCTGGFTARSGNVFGLITAAHCLTRMEYLGQNGIIDFVRNATGAGGGSIDLSFYNTIMPPHQTVAKFYIGDGVEKTTGSVGRASVGQDYCYYGINSLKNCARVQAVDVCATAEGTYYCGMARTSLTPATYGDSGGPWFNGGQAIGIMKGGSSTNTFFTMIGWAGANLSVGVLTN